jgi:hypothetical protein
MRNLTCVARAERAEGDIDIMDWFGGNRSLATMEEAFGLGAYGKTLTVLTSPSLLDDAYGDDDEEDEESLVEQWTPRLRR